MLILAFIKVSLRTKGTMAEADLPRLMVMFTRVTGLPVGAKVTVQWCSHLLVLCTMVPGTGVKDTEKEERLYTN